MNLTDEQRHAVELATTGDGLVVNALAGTGKTTTLSAIAHAMPERQGLYLAFNKSIAAEAQGRFPRTCDCRTAHSLAFRDVGHAWGHRLGRLTGKMAAEAVVTRGMVPGPFTMTGLGYVLIAWVRRFCESADEALSTEHVPYGHFVGVKDEKREATIQALLPFARRLWSILSDPNESLPVSHDLYLKVWALGAPQIQADYVLFDEAQDANAVLQSVIASCGTQVVWAGDKYQSIYSWRGAVDAMERVSGARRCRLTHSWRFGPEIAGVANAVLSHYLGENVGLVGRGDPGIVGVCATPSAVLCRTNATLVGEVIAAADSGKKVTVFGGVDEPLRLIDGIAALRAGRRTNVADLMAFSDYSELLAYVESDEGGDLSTIVRLCESYGAEHLSAKLHSLSGVSEEDADCVFSTIHKAKGREWPSVQVASDLRAGTEDGVIAEEVNILYVGVTRALDHLDPTASAAVLNAMSAKGIALSPSAGQVSSVSDDKAARNYRILKAKRRGSSLARGQAGSGTENGASLSDVHVSDPPAGFVRIVADLPPPVVEVLDEMRSVAARRGWCADEGGPSYSALIVGLLERACEDMPAPTGDRSVLATGDEEVF